MKTPRELILARHQAAVPKLQEISPEDLAGYARASAARPVGSRQLGARRWFPVIRLWEESLWPWRQAWLGMAAVWCVILLVHVSTRDIPTMARAKMPAPSPEVLTLLREQNQILTQLLEPAALPPPAAPKIPGPRSEQRPAIVFT